MPFIEVNGTGLRYAWHGEGSELLVLVHEMGGTLDSWDDVLPRLSPRFRVLRYDTRGAGLSGKVRGPLPIDTMTGDLHALLRALEVTKPFGLAGCAVGGAIALHFAATHPQRVSRLALMGPAIGIAPERRQGILDHAAFVRAEGMMAAAERELPRSYPEILRADRDRFAAFRARWLGNDPDSYAAIYTMLAGLEMEPDLAALRCRTLLLAGEHDPLRPPAMIEPLAARIADAEFRSWNTGHFAAVQTPQLVAETFNDFF